MAGCRAPCASNIRASAPPESSRPGPANFAPSAPPESPRPYPGSFAPSAPPESPRPYSGSFAPSAPPESPRPYSGSFAPSAPPETPRAYPGSFAPSVPPEFPRPGPADFAPSAPPETPSAGPADFEPSAPPESPRPCPANFEPNAPPETPRPCPTTCQPTAPPLSVTSRASISSEARRSQAPYRACPSTPRRRQSEAVEGPGRRVAPGGKPFSQTMLGLLYSVREPLAEHQIAQGLPKAEQYTFPELVKNLCTHSYEAVLAIFTMMYNLAPFLDGFLYLLRFVLDKLIEICKCETTFQLILTSVTLLFEMIAIVAFIIVAATFIMIPVWTLAYCLVGKLSML